jgi:uncharacterized cupredoxin-like copper-binding protein
MAKFRIGVFAAAALTAVLAWALPATSAPSATKSSSAVKVTTVVVTAGKPTEFGFKLSKLTVPKGVVIFKVTNRGAIPHDFKILGKKTRSLNAGQTQSIRVTFTKARKYPFLCTLPSHAVAGMKGTLRVK